MLRNKERVKQTKYANKRGKVWEGCSHGENKKRKVERKREEDDRQVEEVRQSLSESW